MEPRTVGAMQMDTVGANIIRIHWNSELTADLVDGVREYTSELRRELTDGMRIYTVVPLGEGVDIRKDARRAILTLARVEPWAAIAFVGARYEVKVLLHLTLNAVRLLVKDPPKFEFVDTEEEALAWIVEMGASS